MATDTDILAFDVLDRLSYTFHVNMLYGHGDRIPYATQKRIDAAANRLYLVLFPPADDPISVDEDRHDGLPF